MCVDEFSGEEREELYIHLAERMRGDDVCLYIYYESEYAKHLMM